MSVLDSKKDAQNHRRRNVLEPFGSPKWQPKAFPERRKIFIWIRIFMCEMALRRLRKDIVSDKRFDLKKKFKMAPATIGASPTQRLGAVWRPKMAAKGASRAKENLHLDTYFHMRNGSEAFRERYFNG